jgi:hypothetical protein
VWGCAWTNAFENFEKNSIAVRAQLIRTSDGTLCDFTSTSPLVPDNVYMYGWGRGYKRPTSGSCNTSNFTIVAVGYNWYFEQSYNYWPVPGLGS